MASVNLLLSLLFPLLASSLIIKTEAFYKIPMKCSATIRQCNASLYHVTKNNDLIDIEDIASLYSVDVSHLKPIRRPNNEHDDYLVTVPCTCLNTSDLNGFFYQTTYAVKPNDTLQNISDVAYSGQTWILGNHSLLRINETLRIYLLCGCSTSESQNVVTYTVQPTDTIFAIAGLLNSTVDDMKHFNMILNPNPSFIDVGWVLFIPSSDLNGIPLA